MSLLKIVNGLRQGLVSGNNSFIRILGNNMVTVFKIDA